MKRIKTEDAVGQVLCHDMTQIFPSLTGLSDMCSFLHRSQRMRAPSFSWSMPSCFSQM